MKRKRRMWIEGGKKRTSKGRRGANELVANGGSRISVRGGRERGGGRNRVWILGSRKGAHRTTTSGGGGARGRIGRGGGNRGNIGTRRRVGTRRRLVAIWTSLRGRRVGLRGRG